MAQPTVFLQDPVSRFFTVTGDPLAFGKVYSYATGTSTPKAMYSDEAGEESHPNPLILDAAGQVIAYLAVDTAYRIDVFDANDVHQAGYPVDNVSGVTVQGIPFTPVVAGSITPGTGTYIIQSGVVNRVQSMLFVKIVLQWSAHTGSGNMLVKGLPLPALFDTPMQLLFANSSPGVALLGPPFAYLRRTPTLQIEIFVHKLDTDDTIAVDLSDYAGPGGVFGMEIVGIYVLDVS